MSQRSNPFAIYGFYNIAIISFLLLLSPIYNATEYDLYTMESYYDGFLRQYYGRRIHEYIVVISIIVHFFVACHQLLMINFWGNPSVTRIARISGVDHDVLFIIKCLMNQNSEYFSAFIMIGLLIFYSIIIRIVETGYQRSFKMADFTTIEELQAQLVSYGIFDNYKNCVWNMFITMSTIGYGDINVRATISRALIFLIIFSGLSILALMVTDYS